MPKNIYLATDTYWKTVSDINSMKKILFTQFKIQDNQVIILEVEMKGLNFI